MATRPHAGAVGYVRDRRFGAGIHEKRSFLITGVRVGLVPERACDIELWA